MYNLYYKLRARSFSYIFENVEIFAIGRQFSREVLFPSLQCIILYVAGHYCLFTLHYRSSFTNY